MADQTMGISPESALIYPRTVRPLTRGTMVHRAAQVSEAVEDYWQSRGRPQHIIVIGHSIGGVLVRYAYLLALGELGGKQHDWAQHVSRIVLLAAPNRGIDFHRLPPIRRRVLTFAAWTLRGFAALEVRVGSVFMTDLRLTWMRRLSAMGDRAPLVVQLRAGNDELVDREDSRDIEGLPTGVDLRLAVASHNDLPRIDAVREDFPSQRWTKLKEAILDQSLQPQDPPALPADEQQVQSIVFILHGIRALNDTWVSDLNALLKDDPTVGVVTASYGRFSAYNFAFPVTRRRTLRWFQDQYTFHLANHPDGCAACSTD